MGFAWFARAVRFAPMAGPADSGGPGDVHPARSPRTDRGRPGHGTNGRIRVVSAPEEAGPPGVGGGHGHHFGPALRKARCFPHLLTDGVGDRALPAGHASGPVAANLRKGMSTELLIRCSDLRNAWKKHGL